ncbi:hypothetical protein BH24ACT23_BH24ACT23_08730 [soil metagenome]
MKRALFGFRRKDVEAAVADLERKLGEEHSASSALAERAAAADARSFELERASLKLAAKVNDLEQVADRLAERVVEREKQLQRVLAQMRRMELSSGSLPASDAEDGQAAPLIGAQNGHDDVAEPSDLFDGLVEVEVGPLSDFAQLVGFEDAAGDIGAAEEISVKGFARGRATLHMQFSEPVELLRELEERSPFEFKVRDTRENRVVLDLDTE